MVLTHQPGELIANRYQILGQLGTGGSGFTYKARDQEKGELVALKVLSLGQLEDWKTIDLFEREAKILQQLDHSSIPQYLNHFQLETDSDRAFYLVQQLAPGKSLATLVEEGWQPGQQEVERLAEQVLEILVYLQTLVPPVIHRDIKPENLIYQDQGGEGNLFLVDFGAVQDAYHQTTVASTVVGTYGYMAPEQFRGQANLATDLYGLAATLLFLLTGKPPSELPERHLKIDFRREVQLSRKFADWLEQCLSPKAENRFPAAEAALEVLQEQQSIEAYRHRKLERPPYSVIDLQQIENTLIVEIPPAINRPRRDRRVLVLAIVWHLGLFFLIFSISLSMNPLWGGLYVLALIANLFNFKNSRTPTPLGLALQWLLLCYMLTFVLISLDPFSLNVTGALSLVGLGVDLFVGDQIRRKCFCDLLMTTRLEIDCSQLPPYVQLKFRQLLQKTKPFQTILDQSMQSLKPNCFQLGLDIGHNSWRFVVGTLLTRAEKRWLAREINDFLDQ